MSQFFYAPDPANVGISPAPRWSYQWEASTNTTLTVEDPAGEDINVRFTGTDSGNIDNGHFRLDTDSAGNSLAGLTDVETYHELLYVTLGNRQGVLQSALRTQTTANTGYAAGLRAQSDSIQIIRINSNSRSTLASTGFSAQAGVRYSVRSQVIGATIKTKVWPTADPEPVSWSLTHTDTAPISAAGGVGLYSVFPENENTRVFKYGVGTNGDTAPTAPVATGPITPINLSTTNILTTSARLNWEQG